MFKNLPNYTGPYISNGRFQSSVLFGEVLPKDELDELSRLHDSAYAKWPDRSYRAAADVLYNREASQLGGIFPAIARGAVLYGNQTLRSAGVLIDSVFKFGPFGLVLGGIENFKELNGLYDKVNEVDMMYNLDPLKNTHQVGRRKRMGAKSTKRYASDWDYNKGEWLDPNRSGGSSSQTINKVDVPDKIKPQPVYDPAPDNNFNASPSEPTQSVYNPPAGVVVPDGSTPSQDSTYDPPLSDVVSDNIANMAYDGSLGMIGGLTVAGASAAYDLYKNRRKKRFKKKKKKRGAIYVAN